MIYLQLFFEFFKVGLFAIGGGLATLPFLYTLSDKTGWFTYEQLSDMVAISESTPGPIGINTATYVGFTTAGVAGALTAVIGIVFPSVIIIFIIAKFLQSFNENTLVKSIFYGLRPASVGLIAAAGFLVLKVSLLNIDLYKITGSLPDLIQWKSVLLAAVVFFVLKKWKPHPIVVIGLSAVAGAVFGFAGV